jgi:molybdopterin synthase sulfur carrier subunit
MADRAADPPHVTLRYFAWVRERAGVGEETVALPPSLTTMGDVVAWLSGRDERFAAAFAKPDVIRIARNKVHVGPDAPVAGAAEIAFFPPITGG